MTWWVYWWKLPGGTITPLHTASEATLWTISEGARGAHGCILYDNEDSNNWQCGYKMGSCIAIHHDLVKLYG